MSSEGGARSQRALMWIGSERLCQGEGDAHGNQCNDKDEKLGHVPFRYDTPLRRKLHAERGVALFLKTPLYPSKMWHTNLSERRSLWAQLRGYRAIGDLTVTVQEMPEDLL